MHQNHAVCIVFDALTCPSLSEPCLCSYHGIKQMQKDPLQQLKYHTEEATDPFQHIDEVPVLTKRCRTTVCSLLSVLCICDSYTLSSNARLAKSHMRY